MTKIRCAECKQETPFAIKVRKRLGRDKNTQTHYTWTWSDPVFVCFDCLPKLKGMYKHFHLGELFG